MVAIVGMVVRAAGVGGKGIEHSMVAPEQVLHAPEAATR